MCIETWIFFPSLHPLGTGILTTISAGNVQHAAGSWYKCTFQKPNGTMFQKVTPCHPVETTWAYQLWLRENEWWLINFMSDIHGSTVFNYAQLIIINSTKPRKYVIRPILSHLCPEAFVLWAARRHWGLQTFRIFASAQQSSQQHLCPQALNSERKHANISKAQQQQKSKTHTNRFYICSTDQHST